MNNLTSFIAFRYFKAKKKDKLVNFATNISIVCTSISIAFLILSFALVKGFQKKFIEKTINYQGHIIIEDEGLFNPNTIKLSIKNEKVIEVNALIINTKFNCNALVCASSKINIKTSNEFTPIIIGKKLAESLKAKKNDLINIIIPNKAPAPFYMIPETITCQIIEIEEFELEILNENGIFMNLSHLQKILNIENNVQKIKCFIKNYNNAEVIAKQLQKKFPKKQIYTWKNYNSFIIHMINFEKNVTQIVLFILLILASIISMISLSMFINSKKKEINILKSIGASKNHIIKIFLKFSFIIYIISAITGTLFGIILTLNINTIIKFIENTFKIEILIKDLYFDKIHTLIEFKDIFLILILTLIIKMISTFLISKKAFSIDILENL